MDQATYNRKLQDVQELEAQSGLQIIKPFVHYNDDGSIHSAGLSFGGQTVFRQTKPFTPEADYFVDEALWGRIIYSDPTR